MLAPILTAYDIGFRNSAHRVPRAQKTSTVARVKWFDVACSKNCFLFLDIDVFCDGRCKLRPAASRYAASSIGWIFGYRLVDFSR